MTFKGNPEAQPAGSVDEGAGAVDPPGADQEPPNVPAGETIHDPQAPGEPAGDAFREDKN
jgi:hypothetical protein